MKADCVRSENKKNDRRLQWVEMIGYCITHAVLWKSEEKKTHPFSSPSDGLGSCSLGTCSIHLNSIQQPIMRDWGKPHPRINTCHSLVERSQSVEHDRVPSLVAFFFFSLEKFKDGLAGGGGASPPVRLWRCGSVRMCRQMVWGAWGESASGGWGLEVEASLRGSDRGVWSDLEMEQKNRPTDIKTPFYGNLKVPCYIQFKPLVFNLDFSRAGLII